MIDLNLTINREANIPLFEQVYQGIKHLIEAGHIKTGERLPPIREIAKELGISKNTVNNAYQILMEEGLVVSRPKSGFAAAPLDGKGLLELKSSSCIPSPVPRNLEMIDFAYGNLEKEDYPFEQWKQSLYQAMDVDGDSLITIYEKYGELPLKQVIQHYLASSKGIQCSTDQIVIGSGVQQLLLFASLLLKQNNTLKAAIENPSYHPARFIFQTLFDAKSIRLQKNGLDMSQLEDERPDVLYVHSSHMLEFNMVLPMENRIELVRWAASHDALIIEDDFEAEFRDLNKMLPAIKALDIEDRHVIYLGTFSPAVLPVTGISYMVFPKTMQRLLAKSEIMYEQPIPKLAQLTAATFIKEGYFEKQVRRLRLKNSQKMTQIKSSFEQHFGNYAKVLSKDLGMHILAEIKLKHKTEEALIREALYENIRVYPTRKFWAEKESPYPVILLGFSALPLHKIDQAISSLARIWLNSVRP